MAENLVATGDCGLLMVVTGSCAGRDDVDRPIFKVLIAALSAADEPPTRGVACPLYANFSLW